MHFWFSTLNSLLFQSIDLAWEKNTVEVGLPMSGPLFLKFFLLIYLLDSSKLSNIHNNQRADKIVHLDLLSLLTGARFFKLRLMLIVLWMENDFHFDEKNLCHDFLLPKVSCYI